MATSVEAYESETAKLLDVSIIGRIHNGGQKRGLLSIERDGTEVALKGVALCKATQITLWMNYSCAHAKSCRCSARRVPYALVS